MAKKWVFAKPIKLALVKIKGHHYVEETDLGLIEKEKDVVVHVQINNAKDLKFLRKEIRKGKYAEFYNAPLTDQLWAVLAQRIGFMRLIEDDDED